MVFLIDLQIWFEAIRNINVGEELLTGPREPLKIKGIWHADANEESRYSSKFSYFCIF